MVSTGDTIDDIEITVVDDDIATTRLGALTASNPVILAFFPAAFTGTCTNELQTIRDRFPEGIAGHEVYAVSVDSPFVLQEVKSQYDLPYALISDFNRDLIDIFDVSIGFPDIGIDGLAQRSVFALDTDLTVTHTWVADNPGNVPPFEQLEETLTSL